MKEIQELQDEYNKLCVKLGLKGQFKVNPQNDGASHVEFNNNTYYYIKTDRGVEFVKKITVDKDEILYWLISEVIWKYSLQYELEHRIDGQDARRIRFNKEIELFNQINIDWSNKRNREIEAILEINPYTQ